MKIVGYQGVSLIDFPKKIATVFFTSGCNFKCPFCQNPGLIIPDENVEGADMKEVFGILDGRKNFIEGVTVSGGEPTLQNDLAEFLSAVKNRGFKVKLDTNGYKSDVLENLLAADLLDYVAMDIKTSQEKYERAAGRKLDINRIQKSIDLLMTGRVDYEFRTTVAPPYVDESDIEKIADWLSGAKRYSLNQFSNKVTLDPELANVKPYVPDILRHMAEIARAKIQDVRTLGI